jgi:light-regulated signal transduction histidine kinase (bacteriophytochrome)/CheY-like chemotaxis protein
MNKKEPLNLRSNYDVQYEQYPIRTSGYIQPHGVLIVLERKNLNIIQISENVEKTFGLPAQSLLNKNLACLFSSYQVKKIIQYVSEQSWHKFNRFSLKIKVCNLFFQVIIHANNENIILELEQKVTSKTNNKNNLFDILRNTSNRLKKISELVELSEYIADSVRKITQFDRVMIYKFATDNSGIVIAESKEDYLESYLDLHYPESDIPAVARQLYYENWLRIIPDVNYQPVPILPVEHLPLDLTHAFLRSVSPCHLTYLKNMGVTASMSISLIDENKLWGLIACHHYSPKYINYEIRKTCELLGNFMSLQTKVIEEKELYKYKQEIDLIQIKIRQTLAEKPCFINGIIKDNEVSLTNLVKAEGMAMILGEQISLSGKTPSASQVFQLVNGFLKPKKEEIFYTDCLSKDYPEGKGFKDVASGILTISIFLSTTSYHLIWFRPQQEQIVKWAGSSSNPVFVGEDNIPRLSPRGSFEVWKETVNNKSLSWQFLEVEAARELKNVLLLAALEFSQFSQEFLEKTAQQAKLANIAKSQFLAKMSHELRTPLNAILGFTQIMSRDDSLSEQQQDYLGIINRSGEYLLTLINDVLEMSRIEAGQLTLNQGCFDFYALIQSIGDMFMIKASDKGLFLMLQQEEDLPRYLIGDEAKIRQIIVNLMGNAIKFTDYGEVILRVRKVSLQEDYLTLKLEVEDTGRGIEAEHLETVFEPFKQAENGENPEQGTGLGLSISRQFLHLMGGEITVQSEVNRGSIFTCVFPLRVAPKASVQAKIPVRRVIGLLAGQPLYHILVVEDVAENQKLMVNFLETVGFQVSSAHDGFEAIALWQEKKPDLIFMDMRMPQLDGYQATKRIREAELMEGISASVPIIALTATVFDEDRYGILATGCNDVIYKPFREEVLFEIISKYLKVKYVYEDEISPRKNLGGNQPINLQAGMDSMSIEWIRQLYQAAVSARENNILALIQDIPQEYFYLADALTEMLDNLAFTDIINLTESRING